MDYTFAYDHLAQVYAMYFFRKELIERLHNFVHLNFCIALSLGLFFFLTGIHTATVNIVRYMYVCNCHLLYNFNILKVAKMLYSVRYNKQRMTDKANPELWKAMLNSGNLNCYCKLKSDHAK